MKKYIYPSPIIVERIQKVFDDNRLTDEYVAGMIGVNRKTPMKYRHAETNPSIKFIRWLCSTYHVSVEWLLDMK